MTATSFTGLKAQFLNLKTDGLKLRASKIESKRLYSRKAKHKNQW